MNVLDLAPVDAEENRGRSMAHMWPALLVLGLGADRLLQARFSPR